MGARLSCKLACHAVGFVATSVDNNAGRCKGPIQKSNKPPKDIQVSDSKGGSKKNYLSFW